MFNHKPQLSLNNKQLRVLLLCFIIQRKTRGKSLITLLSYFRNLLSFSDNFPDVSRRLKFSGCEVIVIFPTDYILQKITNSVKTMKCYLHKNNPFKVKIFIVILPNTYILFKTFESIMIDVSLENQANICQTCSFLDLILNVMPIRDQNL